MSQREALVFGATRVTVSYVDGGPTAVVSVGIHGPGASAAPSLTFGMKSDQLRALRALIDRAVAATDVKVGSEKVSEAALTENKETRIDEPAGE